MNQFITKDWEYTCEICTVRESGLQYGFICAEKF